MHRNRHFLISANSPIKYQNFTHQNDSPAYLEGGLVHMALEMFQNALTGILPMRCKESSADSVFT